MGYKELLMRSADASERELLMERHGLAVARLSEISEQPEGPEPYADYFRKTAQFLLKLVDICGRAVNGSLLKQTEEELREENQRIYADIMPGAYEKSYADPAYAKKILGLEAGEILCFLFCRVREHVRTAFRGDVYCLTTIIELFIELYREFEDAGKALSNPDFKELKQDIYWYFHDYSEIFQQDYLRGLADPEEDFETAIVMQSDLSDLRYLYLYGAYIGPNERKTAEFLNSLPENEIQAMADTFTEGYRIGFEVTGKDIGKKRTVQIRYPVGFERMVRAAVQNFEKIGLKPTMLASGTPANKQYDYDHREDRAFYMDKAYVERCLEVRRSWFEEHRELAMGHGGPAVIEVFGEEPFAPVQNPDAIRYDKKQQQLRVYEMSMNGRQMNDYMKGEERSFTIIAYPLPAIGEKYKEIFEETVKLNTLDYQLYRDIQQKLIDALDEADTVHITGKGANKTDLYVKIWPLDNPEKETAFENCVADVNIPVGEVFTSPVLAGTHGKLFVSRVYLKELNYENLELDFEDGMITGYTCTNFKEEEENQTYIRENVLMHHATLPMGEFAIGTNTTAYRMARDYGIADKLPILIAEKTGPHFAVGDTCYHNEEDIMTYNPDGKAIVARENAFAARRKDPDPSVAETAYFNCHTDITIPFDELDKITVIRKDGSTTDLITDGRFVLAGTEELNRPLEG